MFVNDEYFDNGKNRCYSSNHEKTYNCQRRDFKSCNLGWLTTQSRTYC